MKCALVLTNNVVWAASLQILVVVRRHRILLWNIVKDALLWSLWLCLLLIIVLTRSKDNFYFFTTHMNDLFLNAHETHTLEARKIVDYRQ